MLLFSWEILLRKQMLFLMKVSQWCDFNRLMDAATQMWFMNKQSTNLKLKTWFLAWKNVKTLTHSHQQPQGPKTHKKKSRVRLTYRTVLWVPQRSLLYRFSVLFEVKCKTHTQQQRTQLKTHLRLVNQTENAEQHTFKAPCCCFENAPNTDLLVFRQSM